MIPATRAAINTVSGTTIGMVEMSQATELHVLGDVDSLITFFFRCTLSYDSDYIGPALVMHAWKRINDAKF